MVIARDASCWSKDPSTKVGAAIADGLGRIVALGYNGFPRKVEDTEDKLSKRELKYEMVLHAEVNAALIAGRSTIGGTIYVYGAPICPRCAGVLIQAGIRRAIAEAPRPETGVKWHQDGLISISMFEEAGVMFDAVDPNEI